MTRYDVLTVAFAVGALGCAAFIAGYLHRSRGWYRSDTGRNLMAMMSALFVLFGLIPVNRMWGPVPFGVWTGVVAALDAVIWWRVLILWRRQHEERTRT